MRHGDEVVAGERHLAAQQLVEDGAEPVDVALRVRPLALRLLGRDVVARADDEPVVVMPSTSTARAIPKSVTFARPSPFRRTFCGLTSRWISPLLVRERERAADLERELERQVDRQRRPAVDELLQRLTRDVLEDDELVAVLLAAVDHGDDPRMAEPGGRARLTAEPLDVLLVMPSSGRAGS